MGMLRSTGSSRMSQAMLALAAGSVLLAGSAARGDSGTWTNNGSSNWDTSTNWLDGTVADGAGFTADFSTLDLGGNRIVTLVSPRTIGNLLFDDTGASGDSSWTLAGTGLNTLTLAGTSPTITSNTATTISAVVAGSSGLTKDGSATLTLSGANSYTGGTTVKAGTLSANNGSAFGGAAGGTVSVLGGTVSIGSQTIANQIDLNGGNISMSSGTASGTLNVKADASFGLSGTGVDTAKITGTLNLEAGKTLYFSQNNGSITVSGTIAGSGTIKNEDLGTFTISNANPDFSGTFTHRRATLSLGNDGALGTATLAFDSQSGAIYVKSADANARSITNNVVFTSSTQFSGAADLTFAGGITLNSSNPTLTINNATTTFSGSIGAAGNGFTKSGAGTLVLSGGNLHTGTTTVSAGTLRAGVASVANISGAFGRNSPVSMANAASAILDLNGYDTQIGYLTGGGATGGNITLNGGTLTIANANSTQQTYAGIISGDGGLAKVGSGPQQLTGANTFTGGITSGSTANPSGGTLTIGNGTIGSVVSQNLTFAGTSGVNFTEAAGSAQAMAALSFSAGDGTLTSTYGGSGNTSLTFSSLSRSSGASGNIVTTNGDYASTNKVAVSGLAKNSFLDRGVFFNGVYGWKDTDGYLRPLVFGADGGSTTSGAVASIASTDYAQATDNVTAQDSASFVALNLYHTGGTARSFTLAPGATVTLGSLLRSGGGAGTFTITDGNGIQAAHDADLVIRTNDALTINSSILANGTNAVVKTGAGALTLGGASAYTGGTYINAGALTANGGSALGTGDVTVAAGALKLGGVSVANKIILAGGSLTFADATTNTVSGELRLASISGTVNVTGNSVTKATLSSGSTLTLDEGKTLSVSGAGVLTVARAVSGKGNLYLDGSTSLAADSPSYAGTTSLVSGTITAGSDTAFGTGLLSFGQRDTGIIFASANAADRTFANRISLSGKSNYNTTFGQSSGGTGNLEFTGNGSLGTMRAVVLNTTEFSGNLSGTAALNLYTGSTGALVFSGANTFAGTVAINAGTLRVNNTSGSGTGAAAVTVGGGTLGGSGTISGAVTVNSGKLAPGNSPGKLTLGSSLTLNGGSIEMEIASQTEYDMLDITGALTYGGTLNVTALGEYDLAQSATYDLFDFGSLAATHLGGVNVGSLAFSGTDGVWSTVDGNATYTFTEASGELTVIVPEPSTSAMLLAGAALLGICSRRTRVGRA